jgi:succinyl-diaminopimelate desuccinylase
MTRPSPPSELTDAPPTPSIVALLRELVRIPSRGGEDSPAPIIGAITRWLTEHGLSPDVLASPDGDPAAVVTTIDGGHDGPTYCLDACLDTAPFGNLDAWDTPPAEPHESDGWLIGRGAADSKAAVATFAHLAAELQHTASTLHGRLLVLFDADEHTGHFAGVKSFLRAYPDIDGAMIGYPGNDRVIAGARGFYRATITVHGTGGHSGGDTSPTQNAVHKAAQLVDAIDQAPLSDARDPGFPLRPSIAATRIAGGSSFSMIPDTCAVDVDVRLTPADSPVASALLAAAREHHDPEVDLAVGGPSNIGNLFAAHGIPATCGFGATYRNLHAPDEAIELGTLASAYKVYRRAVERLLLPTDQ